MSQQKMSLSGRVLANVGLVAVAFVAAISPALAPLATLINRRLGSDTAKEDINPEPVE